MKGKYILLEYKKIVTFLHKHNKTSEINSHLKFYYILITSKKYYAFFQLQSIVDNLLYQIHIILSLAKFILCVNLFL